MLVDEPLASNLVLRLRCLASSKALWLFFPLRFDQDAARPALSVFLRSPLAQQRADAFFFASCTQNGASQTRGTSAQHRPRGRSCETRAGGVLAGRMQIEMSSDICHPPVLSRAEIAIILAD